jgi:hypothetical protein
VLVRGRSHGHPELLHLLAPGDHAPIVVAQDRQRPANEARIEDMLARGIEIVASGPVPLRMEVDEVG